MTTSLWATKSATDPEPPSSPTLSKTIRERLDEFDGADPSVLIEILLDELDDDLYYEAARRGLGLVVDQLISSERRSRRRPSARSGKWDKVAEAGADHRDVFEYRIYTGPNGWKFLGDCDRRDLQYAEDDRRSKGEGLIAEADRFRSLASKLRGGKRVRDLSRKTVEGVFDA